MGRHGLRCGVPIRGRLHLLVVITGVLAPTGLVQDGSRDGEHTAGLVEGSVLVASLVEAILVLEMAETDHVVTAPVLVEELTSALTIDLLERWVVVDLGSVHIRTDLVEQALGRVAVGSRGTAGDGLSLHQDDIGETEDRHVVALDASAEERLTRGFTSMTQYSKLSG